MDSNWKAKRAAALNRFEQITELPLLILALAMIPILVVPLLVELPQGVDEALDALSWFIWGAFTFEYVVRLLLSEDKWRFIRREWPDLLIILLPLLRPLRIVRSARALQVLRLVRLVAVLGELDQEAKRLLVRHRLHYALLITFIVVLGAAALAFAVEDGHDGSIDSFGDAIWWAITTVTTVGYGDTYPVTAAGRGIGAALMVAGITLFGVITANLAAFLLEQVPEQALHEDPQPTNAELMARIEELSAEVKALRTERR